MLYSNMNIYYDGIYQCSDWVACPSVRIDSSTEHCKEKGDGMVSYYGGDKNGVRFCSCGVHYRTAHWTVLQYTISFSKNGRAWYCKTKLNKNEDDIKICMERTTSSIGKERSIVWVCYSHNHTHHDVIGVFTYFVWYDSWFFHDGHYVHYLHTHTEIGEGSGREWRD